MRQPHSLDEAKAIYREEKAKLTGGVSALIGSRAVLAVLTLLMVGFGSHALYAPDRLPPIQGVSLAQLGLPSSLDFGVAGDVAKEARDAALRQGAEGQVTSFVDAHRAQAPLFNLAGAALSALLLAWNLMAAAGKWKTSPGVAIGAP